MVWDPPKQQVNVNRMIIYSFIPILSIYVGWRIQKFWVLLGINIGLSLLLRFFLPEYIILFVTIPLSVLIVRYYAIKYNETIIHNNSGGQQI